jgi:hypothetical protein
MGERHGDHLVHRKEAADRISGSFEVKIEEID